MLLLHTGIAISGLVFLEMVSIIIEPTISLLCWTLLEYPKHFFHLMVQVMFFSPPKGRVCMVCLFSLSHKALM